jgi:hypothetical protein
MGEIQCVSCVHYKLRSPQPFKDLMLLNCKLLLLCFVSGSNRKSWVLKCYTADYVKVLSGYISILQFITKPQLILDSFSEVYCISLLIECSLCTEIILNICALKTISMFSAGYYLILRMPYNETIKKINIWKSPICNVVVLSIKK